MNIKDIELQLLKGDHVTTPELKVAFEHFGRLREDLGALGQRWHFSFDEATRLWNMCRQYLDARKERV